MTSVDFVRLRRRHQTRSLRIAAVLRVGVVILMTGAMIVGTEPSSWPKQGALLGVYAVATLWILVLAMSPARSAAIGMRQRLLFALIDVTVLFGFQLLSTGGYIPLLVMALVPLIVVPQVSWRGAAVVLSVSVAAFAFAVFQDGVIPEHLDWGELVQVVVMYGFLCAIGMVVAYVEGRHVDEITALTASREELLGEVMGASEGERRRISEAIHDGPLQDVIVARQEIDDLAASSPTEGLDRAMTCLRDASQRLREATFELHPAVLEQVGLGAAVDQLAAFTANRTGIAIDIRVDYPNRNAMDPIMFGVVRELLSNIARHSQASSASVALVAGEASCRLDVADDGVGMTTQSIERRLAEGHIGLASQRSRVEAAGGTFTIVAEPTGTHVRVELPLRG